MLGLNHQFDLCDFLFCADAHAIFIGDVEEQHIKSSQCYDVFDSITIIHDNDSSEDSILTNEEVKQDIHRNNVVLIIRDMSDEKYVQESLRICHIACMSCGIVIFCPLIPTDNDIDFYHNVLQKLMAYPNLLMRNIDKFVECAKHTSIENFLFALSDCYDYENDVMISNFIDFLIMQFSSTIQLEAQTQTEEIIA